MLLDLPICDYHSVEARFGEYGERKYNGVFKSSAAHLVFEDLWIAALSKVIITYFFQIQ